MQMRKKTFVPTQQAFFDTDRGYSEKKEVRRKQETSKNLLSEKRKTKKNKIKKTADETF